MANGYGYGSSSTSIRQSSTNAQGRVAPIGFHYMPDGTLMSDVEHARLYGEKTITSFDLDLSDLPAATSTRKFTLIGYFGDEFVLEVKNECLWKLQCFGYSLNISRWALTNCSH